MKKIKVILERDGKTLEMSGQFELRGDLGKIQYSGDKSVLDFIYDSGSSIMSNVSLESYIGFNRRHGYKVTIEEEGEFEGSVVY